MGNQFLLRTACRLQPPPYQTLSLPSTPSYTLNHVPLEDLTKHTAYLNMVLVHGSHSKIYMWGLLDYELMIALDLM